MSVSLTRSFVLSRRTVTQLVLAIVASLAPTAGSWACASDAPVKLAQKRWSELSYGVSLNPPADAEILERSSGDALVHFRKPSSYTISLSIKESNQRLELPDVVRRAVEQMALPYPSAVLIDNKETQLAGRPGARLYFKIPDSRQGTWFMGQSLMQIDPYTVVLVVLETEEINYETARPIYEAVVDTLSVQTPEELDERRQAQIDRGEAWRAKLTGAEMERAFAEEQWLRVMHDNKDVGYMRIRSYRGQEWETPGIRVDVDTRIESDRQQNDSESRFFLTDDGKREFWSTKSVKRPLGRAAATGRGAKAGPIVTEALWVETGLRSDTEAAVKGVKTWTNVISIDRKTPSGAEQHEWQKPPRGYLSQVEVQLLGSLLPHGEAADYGFYAYSSATGEISYRTDRVEPQADGTYKVFSRLSPTAREQMSHYDGQGQLLERILPSGLELHPAPPARIKAIWNMK